MAALAVQYEGWNTVEEDLSAYCQPKANMHGVLLSLYAELPNETLNPRISIAAKRRGDHIRFLGARAPQVLHALETLMGNAGNDVDIQSRVFDAFASWVRFGQTSPEALAQNKLSTWAFEALNNEELWPSALDAIVEVVRASNDEVPGSEAIMQIVLPRVAGLSTVIGQDDHEQVKGVSRIAMEVGESFRNLMLSGRAEGLQVAEVVLKCTAVPWRDIASQAMYFWQRLTDDLVTVRAQAIEQGNGEAEVLRQASLFQPFYMGVLSVLMFQIERPRDWERLSVDSQNEWEEFRELVGLTVRSCCGFLGPTQLLGHFGRVLRGHVIGAHASQSASFPWQPLEAILFCIRSVGPAIPRNETQTARAIFSILPDLVTAIRPPRDEIRRATVMMLGSYSHWLSSNPDFISDAVAYSTESLQMPPTASAAAKAIHSICSHCAGSIVTSESAVQDLINLHLNTPRIGHLSLEERSFVCQGVTAVISRISPRDRLVAALRMLVAPLNRALSELLQMVHTPAQVPVYSRIVCDQLALLAATLGSLRPCDTVAPQTLHPSAAVLEEMWPIIERLLVLGDSYIMERIVFVFQSVMAVVAAGGGKPGVFSETLLGHYIEAIGQLFAASRPLCCFLRGARHVVKWVGTSNEHAQVLSNMLDRLTDAALSLLHDEERASRYPDVADEFFRLLEITAIEFPLGLVFSERLAPLMECTVVGLHNTHPVASIAVLSFLETFAKCRTERRVLASQQALSRLDEVFLQFGGRMTSALMGGLCGLITRRDVSTEESAALWQIAASYPAPFVGWMQVALSSLPRDSDAQRAAFFSAVSECVGSLSNEVATVREQALQRLRHALFMLRGSFALLN